MKNIDPRCHGACRENCNLAHGEKMQQKSSGLFEQAIVMKVIRAFLTI